MTRDKCVDDLCLLGFNPNPMVTVASEQIFFISATFTLQLESNLSI
jgi:hypothetical protein